MNSPLMAPASPVLGGGTKTVSTKLGTSRIARPAPSGFLDDQGVNESYFPIATQAPECGKQPRQLRNGPQIYYASAVGQSVGGADADYYIQLPFPCKVFALVSIKTPQNSVFFHLNPLGKGPLYAASGSSILPTGLETWFPMTSQPVTSSAPFYWTILRFKEPIQDFYLDMGHENGQPNALTIACLAEDDALILASGPYA